MNWDFFSSLSPLIIDGLWGTPISRLFTILILSLSILFPILAIFSRNKTKFLLFDHVPVLLTTVGLFGTFVGIAVGLGSFDVNSVDRSLPQLLIGMKLAFWTSILGMACSLIYKIIQSFSVFFNNPEEHGGANSDDIFLVLSEQRKALSRQEDIFVEIRTLIKQKLEDKSLSEEVSYFRTETKEAFERNIEIIETNLNNIINSQMQFMDNMTKNSTESLIKALNDVLRDFNTKINEQFGENFKELNKAVGALLIWQENYKIHIETVESNFKRATEGIAFVSEAMQNISQSAGTIPGIMENLTTLINTLEIELEKASELLESFASLRNESENVSPAIKKGIEDLTVSLSESVLENASRTEKAITKQEEVFLNVASYQEELSVSLNSMIKKELEHFNTMLFNALSLQETTLDGISKRYTDMALTHESLVQKGIESLESSFSDVFLHIGDDLKAKFDEFDVLMEKEMSNAIVRLGRQMASIAEKLVAENGKMIDQYSKLAEPFSLLLKTNGINRRE